MQKDALPPVADPETPSPLTPPPRPARPRRWLAAGLLVGAGALGASVFAGAEQAALAQDPGPAPAAALPAPPPAAPLGPPAPEPLVQVAPEQVEARDVDLVIALDTSGSMDNLLDATRRKLWELCTLVGSAQPAPRLRVALVSFGGNENPDGGYVVVRSGFTDELDLVNEELMSLQAAGGTELVGRALRVALDELEWSQKPDALQMLFVAGNESADQDREHDFRALCAQAAERGIAVNAIYCGADATHGDALTWRQVAQAGGGQYAAIDPSQRIDVETPFDQEITALGEELNGTYLAYGLNGGAGAANQMRQDQNARSLGWSTSASRAVCKSTGAYGNGSWDLIDACEQGKVAWDELSDEELPEELRGKSTAEKEAYVQDQRQRRQNLQTRIQELGKQRQGYIDQALAEQQGTSTNSIDFALLQAVQTQAEAHGLSFTK